MFLRLCCYSQRLAVLPASPPVEPATRIPLSFEPYSEQDVARHTKRVKEQKLKLSGDPSAWADDRVLIGLKFAVSLQCADAIHGHTTPPSLSDKIQGTLSVLFEVNEYLLQLDLMPLQPAEGVELFSTRPDQPFVTSPFVARIPKTLEEACAVLNVKRDAGMKSPLQASDNASCVTCSVSSDLSCILGPQALLAVILGRNDFQRDANSIALCALDRILHRYLDSIDVRVPELEAQDFMDAVHAVRGDLKPDGDEAELNLLSIERTALLRRCRDYRTDKELYEDELKSLGSAAVIAESSQLFIAREDLATKVKKLKGQIASLSSSTTGTTGNECGLDELLQERRADLRRCAEELERTKLKALALKKEENLSATSASLSVAAASSAPPQQSAALLISRLMSTVQQLKQELVRKRHEHTDLLVQLLDSEKS